MSVRTEPRAKNAHLWARDPHDWYVEPQWCSERLFDVEEFEGAVVDPSCGSGRIVQAAINHSLEAWGQDIVDRGGGVAVADFFACTRSFDNIVSNPPFGVADRYVSHALWLSLSKVAMLLPTKWMNSAARGRWLETTPLERVWLLAPRPSMPPGAVLAAGEKPGNGTVDFAWFVWRLGYVGRPELRWLRRVA